MVTVLEPDTSVIIKLSLFLLRQRDALSPVGDDTTTRWRTSDV